MQLPLELSPPAKSRTQTVRTHRGTHRSTLPADPRLDATQHQPLALFLLTNRACAAHPTLWMLLASIPRATDPTGAL